MKKLLLVLGAASLTLGLSGCFFFKRGSSSQSSQTSTTSVSSSSKPSSSSSSTSSSSSSSHSSSSSSASSSSSSSSSSSFSQSSSITDGPHGPAGSTLVSWYLVGQGSLWHDSWSIEGGIQLYSNPNNLEDKGCLLNVSFVTGDTFKVTDGDTWFGYEKVDPYEDPSNKGKTCFEPADDGYGGTNFRCTVSGAYDVYVNATGTFWIQSAA